jgi:hypothetical protein
MLYLPHVSVRSAAGLDWPLTVRQYDISGPMPQVWPIPGELHLASLMADFGYVIGDSDDEDAVCAEDEPVAQDSHRAIKHSVSAACQSVSE